VLEINALLVQLGRNAAIDPAPIEIFKSLSSYGRCAGRRVALCVFLKIAALDPIENLLVLPIAFRALNFGFVCAFANTHTHFNLFAFVGEISRARGSDTRGSNDFAAAGSFLFSHVAHVYCLSTQCQLKRAGAVEMLRWQSAALNRQSGRGQRHALAIIEPVPDIGCFIGLATPARDLGPADQMIQFGDSRIEVPCFGLERVHRPIDRDSPLFRGAKPGGDSHP
jgi:hypothetical protein